MKYLMKSLLILQVVFFNSCGKDQDQSKINAEKIKHYNDFPEKCKYRPLNGIKDDARVNSLMIMKEFDKPMLFQNYFNNGNFDSLQVYNLIYQINSQCDYKSRKGGYVDHRWTSRIGETDIIQFYYDYQYDCNESVKFSFTYEISDTQYKLLMFGAK